MQREILNLVRPKDNGKTDGLGELVGPIVRVKVPHPVSRLPCICQLWGAAEVAWEVVRENGGPTHHFLEKARYLAAIHRAQREVWCVLAGQMLQQGLNLKQTKDQTYRCLRFEAPPRWGDFLPLPCVVRGYLELGDPSSQAVAKPICDV